MKKAEADQIFTEELYQLPAKVLVLIPHPWSAMRQEDEILLSKILGSVKVSIDGVQVISSEESDLNALKIYNPSHILSFGSKLTPECPPYIPQQRDGVQILQSDNLQSLDDTKKKSLWNALKQAFTR